MEWLSFVFKKFAEALLESYANAIDRPAANVCVPPILPKSGWKI